MKKTVLFTSLLSVSLTIGLPLINNSSKAKFIRATNENPISTEVQEGSQTLRLLNWEDYIYQQDEENGYYEKDLILQFEDYARNLGYKDVKVVYSTTDTNETMLNELETGKAHFDLICPSDYGIQRLMANDLLVNLKDLMEKYNLTNYENYASPTMKNYMDNIKAINKKTNEEMTLSDYGYGYMWGTLGLIINPKYDLFQSKGYDPLEVINDMMDYSVLWDDKYHGSISLKDSVRDTYFVGLAEALKEELLTYKAKYDSGEWTSEKYNATLNSVLNRCDDKTLEEVRKTLFEVKKNIFGLEVDSGKQDIVKGTIGINLAWSGDSVTSLNIFDDYQKEIGQEVDYPLVYALPKTGANIWFDGWCMPKDIRSKAQEHLAALFIDFCSDPKYASQNVDYIGYSSFIAGDETLDLMRDWYDFRTDLLYFYDENGNYKNDSDRYRNLYYKLEDGRHDVWYDDCHDKSENQAKFDNVKLYYEDENKQEKPFMIDGKQATYNEHLIIDKNALEKVDLSYFFNGTLDKYKDDIDTTFYSDCYLPYSYKDENGVEHQNRCVGRQFFTQFPDVETINRCVVMNDFGSQNDAVRRMWEDFKSNIIEPWIYIVFTIIVGGLLGLFITKTVSKFVKKHNRNKRLKEAKRNN